MVGKDKIEITAELKDLLTGQLKNIQNEASKLDNTLKNLGDGGTIGGKSGGGGMQKSMTSSILGANLMTQGIMMATGAIKDFATSSVDAYMKNEMYEARLTTLLHSRESALSALSQITKDASKTPFDKESLVQGNSMLIGAGESASKARKSIMDLGNAIAATGGGSDELSRMSVNLAQIKSIGKASALDVKQFMYANIPIYDMLSKSMGKNIKEIKEMDISYKDLTKALSDARKEGGMFYQGLENANKTLSGQVSNLGDSWEQLKVSIAGSQEGILKDTVSWANGMVSQLNKVFNSEDNKHDAYKKYGAEEYSAIKRYAPGQLLAGLFGKSKVQEDTKYQDALNSTYINGDYKNEASILRSMANLKQQIANNTGSGALKEKGTFEYKQDLAILKGTYDRLEGIYNEFKKPKDSEGKDLNKGGATKEASSLEKVAAANKPTQYNINIENLVREYSNTFNSASEALKMTPEQVAKVLIGAVNDISNLNYT